jgi:hypothetical protein
MQGFIHMASLFQNSPPSSNGAQETTRGKTLFFLETYHGNSYHSGENHHDTFMNHNFFPCMLVRIERRSSRRTVLDGTPIVTSNIFPFVYLWYRSHETVK